MNSIVHEAQDYLEVRQWDSPNLTAFTNGTYDADNTTVFTMVARGTLTTELAGLARFGVNPSISALAVVIMLKTISLTSVHALWPMVLQDRISVGRCAPPPAGWSPASSPAPPA